MKKTATKILAAILTLAMIASLFVPAFAMGDIKGDVKPDKPEIIALPGHGENTNSPEDNAAEPPAEGENPASAEDVNIETGARVTFGAYPQTRVTDETLTDALNSLAMSWTYYDYYVNQTREDFMKYADVTYHGNKYRAVTFSHYRPEYTTSYETTANDSHQDDNGYFPDTVYWFRYEPIVWRVLDASAGLMVTERLIDSQAFHNRSVFSSWECYGDTTYSYYATNWAYSSLRNWMNGDFFGAAFSADAQSFIKSTSLATPSSYKPDYNADATTDKVFLLSLDDVLNPAYGFPSSDAPDWSGGRTAYGTDYAKCQGLYLTDSVYFNGASYWRLRSPRSSTFTNYVVSDGHISGTDTYSTDIGIRPALCMDLQAAIAQSAVKEYHEFGELIPEVPATCAENGTKAHYVCSYCGKLFDREGALLTDESVVIPATGEHDTELTGTKEATETEDGYTGDEVCKVCGETVGRGEVIPAVGVQPETPDTPAETADVCALCGETHTGIIGWFVGYFHIILSLFSAVFSSVGT